MRLIERLGDRELRGEIVDTAMASMNLLVDWINARSTMRGGRLLFGVSGGELEMARSLWYFARLAVLDEADLYEQRMSEDHVLQAMVEQLVIEEAFGERRTATPETLRTHVGVIDHFLEHLELSEVRDG